MRAINEPIGGKNLPMLNEREITLMRIVALRNPICINCIHLMEGNLYEVVNDEKR
jgi:hypothetical protein